MSNNIPAQSTSFVGRETDIASICEILSQPDCRLLTLVGPGGIGKTRLSLEVASRLDDYEDGVHFVDLTPVLSADTVPSTIAGAIGFQFSQSGDQKSTQDQLLNYLSIKHTLLVLDNLEHLVDAGLFLEEILETAPDVKLLVTSRVPLNSTWEWLYEVQGLPVDGEAVDLFVQRAKRINSRLDTVAEMPHILTICQLMEGMPLGLELAATWIRALTCAELVEELSINLDLLTHRQRDDDDRHHSLQAVFDHSWRLLPDELQEILMRLSVFRGGFTRDAANAVAGASLAELTDLIDHSLVRQDNEGRYTLHELVRQFSAIKLADDPEEETLARDRHAHHYLTTLAKQEGRLKGSEVLPALRDISQNMDNIRAAWEWAVETQQADLIARTLETIYQYYKIQENTPEASHLLYDAAQRLEDENAAWQCQLYGFIAWSMTEYKTDQIITDMVAHLPQARARNNPGLLALALAHAGFCHNAMNKREGARVYLNQALALYEAIEDLYGQAIVNRYLGESHQQDSELHLNSQQVFSHFQRALELSHQANNQVLLHRAYLELAKFEQAQHNYQSSLDYCSKCLEIGQEIGNPLLMAATYLVICRDHLHMGKFQDAYDVQLRALEIFRRFNATNRMSYSLQMLGHLQLNMGRPEQGKPYYEEALEIARYREDIYGIVWSTVGLATALQHMRDCKQAVETMHRALRIIEAELAPIYMVQALSALSFTQFVCQDFEAGRVAGEKALTLLEMETEASEHWKHRLRGNVLANLAHNLLALSEVTQAMQAYREALELSIQVNRPASTLETLTGIAQGIALTGDIENAATILAFITKDDRTGDHRKVAQQALQHLEQSLPDNWHDTMEDDLTSMTLEDIVELALHHPMWQEIDAASPRPQPLVDPLSERELEVLALLAEGKSNRQMAEDLFVTVGTIKTHVHRIIGKLDADNRTHAVIKAQELGIL